MTIITIEINDSRFIRSISFMQNDINWNTILRLMDDESQYSIKVIHNRFHRVVK